MKLIPLSQTSKTNAGKYYAMVDDEDYDFLMQWKWQVNKNKHTIYAVRFDSRKNGHKTFLMHRVIMKINDSKKLIDHKDMNGLNNQKNNLRECTKSQNSFNTNGRDNTSSVYKGVQWSKVCKKWQSNITYNGEVIYLGLFIKEQDAAKEYNKAAKKYFGEFAKINLFLDDSSEAVRHKRCSSIYKGVRFEKSRNKYISCIWNGEREIKLGRFDKEIDAAIEYNRMAIILFGSKAKINKIEND